ncbi:MAG: hypothetical protein AAGD96_30970 [Chloroflexota bacterium]
MIYYIKQEFMSFGRSFTIFNESMQEVFSVEKRTFIIGGRGFDIQSLTSHHHASIRRESYFFPVYTIGKFSSGATLSKKFSWFSQKFQLNTVERGTYEIKGSVWNRKLEFFRDDKLVATMIPNNFSWQNAYGVAIDDGEEVITILAACIAIDRIKKGLG